MISNRPHATWTNKSTTRRFTVRIIRVLLSLLLVASLVLFSGCRSDKPVSITPHSSESTTAINPSNQGAPTTNASADSAPTDTPTAVPTPTPKVYPTSRPTPTPKPSGELPTAISIPDLNIDAKVIPIGLETVLENGSGVAAWEVTDPEVAGWHETSAPLGTKGNTVINGHNYPWGAVFQQLYLIEEGTLITVRSERRKYTYKVNEILFLLEKHQPLEIRRDNARYVQHTMDERLTLVSCHPFGDTTYRLIVIAFPLVEE